MKTLDRIDAAQIDVELALKFSLSTLREGPVLPLKVVENGLRTVAAPLNGVWPWCLIDDISREAGEQVVPVYVPHNEILNTLNHVFDMASSSAEQMLENLESETDLSREIEEVADLLDTDDEAPLIRLVNTLISQALKDRASDIHIEPFEERVLVRNRVDGVLRTVVSPPKGLQSPLVSRIKVMASLDIAEKRLPQDGRFRVKIAGREVDVRVSVLPTAYGERVVMRLLDRGAQLLKLDQMGMREDQLNEMKSTLTAPHGIVLVTGPTGSGKTTTLYASLTSVDRENFNVMTIEDPIEYQLEKVGQMQTKSSIGVTFAAGLRSILRQDPDIIMVGEIRDKETAEIAIQASLTGHLVFSTLHTNDALSAIVRLRDMGIDPYLVASSLILVQAQRLIRKLCSHCKLEIPLNAETVNLLGVGPELFKGIETIYEPGGCEQCNNSGFHGRTGIYEVIPVSSNLRTAINDGEGLHQLRRIVSDENLLSLRYDGVRHIAAGLTSVDEVLRVSWIE